MFTATLFTVARTEKQLRCPLTDEWIKKIWHISTMEYYSAIKRNTSESILMRWMNLEPVTQSEGSQKNRYPILTCIYGIQEGGTDEPFCRAAVDTDIGNKLVDTVG